MRRSGLASRGVVWAEPLPTCWSPRGFSVSDVVGGGLPPRPRYQRSPIAPARSTATTSAIQRAALMRATVRTLRFGIRRASRGHQMASGRGRDLDTGTRVDEVEERLAGEAVAFQRGEHFEVAAQGGGAWLPAPAEERHAMAVRARGPGAEVAAGEGARAAERAERTDARERAWVAFAVRLELLELAEELTGDVAGRALEPVDLGAGERF